MKKILTISVISLLGVALTTSAALASYGKNGKLAGYVKEYQTLIPLAKSKVKLYNKSGNLKDTDTTSKKGKYSFSDLKEGTYRVKAKADGYRNPKDFKKDYVSKTVKVKGSDRKNLYLQKI
ncbi:MAG: carboxypeptidase regulatory-like domain-containing protein [Parcubacteria group bacterium]|jgi:uncharacterized protein YfaS (alpha-2-macroglobulin family)